MKDCRDIRKLIPALHDGEIAPEDRARVEAHLKACPDCARELAELAESRKALKGLARVRATDDFLERVRARLERPKPAERRSPFFAGTRWIKIPLEIAAAAGAVFLIYSVARQEPALYRPPAAPALRMEIRTKAEDAKSAPRGQLALKSVAERRETAEMDYAAAPLPRLRVSLPPAADQDMYAGAMRMAKARTAGETGRDTSFREEMPAAAVAPYESVTRDREKAKGGAGEDILFRIAEAARGVGGREITPAEGEAKAVAVEIPLLRYEDFLREIGRIGEIEPVSPPALPRDRETIRLLIEIL